MRIPAAGCEVTLLSVWIKTRNNWLTGTRPAVAGCGDKLQLCPVLTTVTAGAGHLLTTNCKKCSLISTLWPFTSNQTDIFWLILFTFKAWKQKVRCDWGEGIDCYQLSAYSYRSRLSRVTASISASVLTLENSASAHTSLLEREDQEHCEVYNDWSRLTSVTVSQQRQPRLVSPPCF